MNDSRPDDTPAFAATAVGPCDDLYHQPGLSIRQYYAAKAMQAMISNTLISQGFADAKRGMTVEAMQEFDMVLLPKIIATASFIYADAMIAHETTTPDNEAKTEAP